MVDFTLGVKVCVGVGGGVGGGEIILAFMRYQFDNLIISLH